MIKSIITEELVMTGTLSLKKEKEFSQFLKLSTIENDEDLENMAVLVDKIDQQVQAGAKELQYLLDYLINQIEHYEEDQEQPHVTGDQILRFLMDQHSHKLKDLTDIAPMSVISEILNGKRKLNRNHIEKLSKKYHTSPAVFF